MKDYLNGGKPEKPTVLPPPPPKDAHEVNGQTFKFGYKEMCEFAEQSSDVRVKIMMMRIHELRSKCARWSEEVLKLESQITQLKMRGEK